MMKNEKMANAKNTDEICAQRESTWRRELAEMPAWAQAHGSAHLRTAIAHNYEPISLYVRERLAREWPEWELYKTHIPTSEIEYPTEAALQVEAEARERIATADCPMTIETRLTHNNQEIVIVEGYLGQWTIFRLVG